MLTRLRRRHAADRGEIAIPTALLPGTALLDQRRGVERVVIERLAPDLARRGHAVVELTVELPERPAVGATWWAFADLADGRQLPIVCALCRSWRGRPTVRWHLQSVRTAAV